MTVWTSTGSYEEPEKVRVIEGGDIYDLLIGKSIYQCDECGHIWISEEVLKVGDNCPACEEGQI